MGLKLGELLFEHYELNDLVHLLLVPVQLQGRPCPLPSYKTEYAWDYEYNNEQKNEDPSPVATGSGLCSLPVELHHRIFFFIPFIDDVVSLGMTNQYFLSIALHYMEDYYVSSLGAWAGKNLVAVGEYVQPGDFPPGLFSAEELEAEFEAFRQLQIDVPDYKEYDAEFVPEEPFTLWHFTCQKVSEPSGLEYPINRAMRLRTHCRHRGMRRDSAWPSVEEHMYVDTQAYLPRDEQWILRNLTTKQIVRSEAIALSPDYIQGPHMEFLGFGEVLLSRIAWSTDPSVNMKDTTNISRGVWAGHRFDITTRSKHETETGGDGWIDVSDEVKTEIADIWENEFGADWRDQITKGRESLYY
ncbi:hypothetical protein O1611_g5789 [Lasiodiplodia mahajangana]|uniref:Uncharacterized protein n=1 Tax=Lasiodiplodia mahajangana TaxID=1108764 RepID=A0ACC2JJZ2_9PEZI|nr:hypothetical protein O1611_g5789 [Lasiodiplodia mahajangana]